ncbi:MAG: WYL domain-containing protein [Nocardioidaceae bacterium]|nr:WYL domain-containing protein [Nocardioidaceae bacterium]
MERLVRIAAVLHANAGRGVSGERLAEVAGFDGQDRADQVARELRHLGRQGWQIENIGAPGGGSVYRMTTVDNRLRVRLSPAQQTALRRAALLADRDDLAERLGLPEASRPVAVTAQVAADAAEGSASAALSTVVRAVRGRRLLRFGYKGTPRVVHPESVRTQNGRWYLRGVVDADLDTGLVKTFVVARMSDVAADEPGTAERFAAARHIGLHPMTWELDEPVDVTLSTTAEHEPDVRRWLGAPVDVRVEPDGSVTMVYRVTHREALHARLYELGRRVRLVGPADVRADFVEVLAGYAGLGALR